MTITKSASMQAIKGDFSIEAWVKMTPQADTAPPSSWDVFMNYAGVPQFRMLVTTDAFKAQLYFRPGTSIVGAAGVTYPIALATGMTNLNDGKWHHLVGVRSGATALIYVDGKPDGSDTNPAVLTANAANGGLIDTSGCKYARIGAIHTGPGHCTSVTAEPNQKHFPGLIDEVRLFNRALSAAEVLALSKWTSPAN